MKSKFIFDTELETPQILHPSRKKWLWICILLLVLSAFPLLSLYFGVVAEKDKTGVYFGVFSIIAISLLSFYASLPSVSYLKLTKTGFESCYLTRKKSFRWKHVTDFGVHLYINCDPIIGFNVQENFQDSSWFMKTSTVKSFEKLFNYKYSMPKNYSCDTLELIDHLKFLVQKFNT
jgi:hypothetical protein